MWFGLNEWVTALRAKIGDKCIFPNVQGVNEPKPWHIFDAVGYEDNPRPLDYWTYKIRAAVYQKTFSQVFVNNFDETLARQFMVLDVFPGRNLNAGGPDSGTRDAWRKVLPVLRVQNCLGWEPMPFAQARARAAYGSNGTARPAGPSS